MVEDKNSAARGVITGVLLGGIFWMAAIIFFTVV